MLAPFPWLHDIIYEGSLSISRHKQMTVGDKKNIVGPLQAYRSNSVDSDKFHDGIFTSPKFSLEKSYLIWFGKSNREGWRIFHDTFGFKKFESLQNFRLRTLVTSAGAYTRTVSWSNNDWTSFVYFVQWLATFFGCGNNFKLFLDLGYSSSEIKNNERFFLYFFCSVYLCHPLLFLQDSPFKESCNQLA